MRKIPLLLITLLTVLVACAPSSLGVPGQAETLAAADAEAAAAETTEPEIATDMRTAVEKVPDAGNEAKAASSTASLADSVLLSIFEERHEVRPVDPATGQDLAEYAPIDLGINNFWPVLAPDGRILAAVDTASRLHLVDLETWQDTVTELRFPNVSAMAFNPDGTRLALTFDDRKGPSLALVDVARQVIMARIELDFWPR